MNFLWLDISAFAMESASLNWEKYVFFILYNKFVSDLRWQLIKIGIIHLYNILNSKFNLTIGFFLSMYINIYSLVAVRKSFQKVSKLTRKISEIIWFGMLIKFLSLFFLLQTSLMKLYFFILFKFHLYKIYCSF